MNSVVNILRPFSLLILLGLLQRIFLFLVSYNIFEDKTDFVFALSLGLLFDLSFLSVLFLAMLLLGFLKEKITKGIFFFFITLWAVLNAFDLFSFTYLGTRASFNSFNLFRLSDIAGKAFDSGVTVVFLLHLLIFIPALIFLRKKIIPVYPAKGFKQKAIYFSSFFICSLMYLPYPLNYYSDRVNISKEAKQMAANPYFSWITSFFNSSDPLIMDKEEALELYKKQIGYSTPSEGNVYSRYSEDFIQRTVNYTDSAYDNIILVLMESFGANRTGILNGEKKLSPFFDSLCNEGILYTKCFSCGPRTQYAISSVLYGFPHILGYNLFRENKLKLPFNGLSALLEKNKYKTHFIHGGDAGYDDMNLFLNSDKPVIIKEKNDIQNFKFKNSWGIDDESLFNYCANYIQTGTGKNLYCILSMSNHEPFQIPKDFNTDKTAGLSKAEKSFLYSDYALGNFIKKLKESKKYEKSLIIVTGDHGELYSNKDADTKLFHVPLLIIDHKNKGLKINKAVSHADIAEYILSKTKYSGKSHLTGLGLIKNGKNNVYYRNYNNDIYSVADSAIYCYNIYQNSLNKLQYSLDLYVSGREGLPLNDPKNKLIAESIKAYFTAARLIFEGGMYHTKPR